MEKQQTIWISNQNTDYRKPSWCFEWSLGLNLGFGNWIDVWESKMNSVNGFNFVFLCMLVLSQVVKILAGAWNSSRPCCLKPLHGSRLHCIHHHCLTAMGELWSYTAVDLCIVYLFMGFFQKDQAYKYL